MTSKRLIDVTHTITNDVVDFECVKYFQIYGMDLYDKTITIDICTTV